MLPSLSWKENFLRAAELRKPEFIPCRLIPTQLVWNAHREKLEELAPKYSAIRFSKPGAGFRPSGGYVDQFGCRWRFCFEGDYGYVTGNPLSDWEQLRNLKIPDPEEGLLVHARPLVPWDEVYEGLRTAKEAGELVTAHPEYGFFFERLSYLRGYSNLLMDFIRKPSELFDLIERLTEYNLGLVERLLRFDGLDAIFFGDDLGTQDRTPMRQSTFRELLYPFYRRIFSRVREAGVHVYMESDGHVIEVVDDLIEAGVSILRLQDEVNGVENIAAKCKGRICVDIDLDRQYIMPFGTPEQVRTHVKRVVRVLGSRKGGLMLGAELYSPTPIDNIEAVLQAMENYMWYYGE